MITSLSRSLGCDFPVFAFSHCRDVVVEVTRAGGFGVLGAASFSPEDLERELKWIDGHIGDKRYGVDILMTSNYNRDVAGKEGPFSAQLPRQQLEFVERWLNDEGVPQLDKAVAKDYADRAVARERYITDEGVKRLLDVTYGHPKVKLLVAALGVPPASVVDEAHRRGMLVGALCGDPKHAERHCERGVDVVVAQGSEAGGHTGTISTMVMLPQVVEICAGRAAVVSAGGYAHGSQILAALAMGAEGVWMGSVWLGTKESELLPFQKERLYAASSRETVQTKSMTGKPVRALAGKYTNLWDRPDAPPALMPPLQRVLFFQAMDRVNRANRGDLYSTPVGQVVGMMNEEETCKSIMYRLQKEYTDATDRLTTLSGQISG